MESAKVTQKYHLLGTGDEGMAGTSPRHSFENYRPLKKSTNFSRKSAFLLIAISGLLLTCGFGLGYAARRDRHSQVLSPYITVTNLPPLVNLATDNVEILWWNTPYSNETASDSELNELWDSQIPWESGIIALTNDEARALNLPESQPFPWDGSRKSLYIVNAHHVLHCVRNLYISIQQYRTNARQTIDYHHILHCLDTLRLETMCSADDTLRYVPLNSAHGFRPGDGQRRMCRSWDRVQQFVESHDPCYRYLSPGDTEISNLERFKFCPEGSSYLPKIRKYFGYDDHWTPEPQEGPRELVW
ncbi:hypothetical protein F5Y14DRAFT_458698 [Nemania sp. NC0429]|nr:hypothetical protein F5Y14DRAFT_458698 [Nemania sp. NC0429]